MKFEGSVSRKILKALALSGAVAIASTSPFFLLNILKAYFKKDKYEEYRKFKEKRQRISYAFSYLKRNRLIIFKEKKDGELTVRLTEKGERRVKKYQIDDLAIETPSKWDKKWRVVIFDIPDKKKRAARDALREKLKQLNFYPLQKSIWAHPYPCHNEIQLLVELFDVYPFVNFIIADDIHNDIKLKEYFDLL